MNEISYALVRKNCSADLEEHVVSPHVRVALDERGATILDTHAGKIFRCNGMAGRMWRGISIRRNADELIAEIASEYGVKAEEVRVDFLEFLDELKAGKLLTRLALMRVPSRAVLLVEAFRELIRFDLCMFFGGFRRLHRELANTADAPKAARMDREAIKQIVDAVSTAGGFYWKPVKCLQKSTAIARLLREFGIPAQLTIGYRTLPFMSHAWVEVDGQVVGDSAALPQRLAVLHRV